MNVEKILPDLGLEVGDTVDFLGASGTVYYVGTGDMIVGFKRTETQDEATLFFSLNGTRGYSDEVSSLKLTEKKMKQNKSITI